MRRFEKHDNSVNAHKYWEIHESGGGYHTEYGRVGGYGRPEGRSRSPKGYGLHNSDRANKHIQEKLRGGYREVDTAIPYGQVLGGISRTPDRAPKPKPPSGLGLINWTTL